MAKQLAKLDLKIIKHAPPETKRVWKKLGVINHIDAHAKFQGHYSDLKKAIGVLGTAINQGTDQDVYDAAKVVRGLVEEEIIDDFVRAAW